MNYVIFDMDGVLVDSEPIHLELEKKVFNEVGLNISDTYHYTLVGMSPKQMWQKICSDFVLKNEAEELLEIEKAIKYSEIQKREIYATDGLLELLGKLKISGFKMSVGSSSTKNLINLFTHKIGVRSYFDFLVSSEDVENGKPFPDIFLKVAQMYSTDPSRCVVIEDSSNGVAAAKAAGMKCVGYRNPSSGNQDLSNADLTISNFNELSVDMLTSI